MPTIKINERDLSWYYRQREPGQLVVLMPGVASWGPVFTADKNQYPILLNEDNFTKVLGDSSVHANEDFSYHMALSFVKAGIDVYFLRIDPGFTSEDIASATTCSPGIYSFTLNTQAESGDKLVVNGLELVSDNTWGITTANNASKIVDILSKSTDDRVRNYDWTVSGSGSTITATEKKTFAGVLGAPDISTTGTLSVSDVTSTPVGLGTAGVYNCSISAPATVGDKLKVNKVVLEATSSWGSTASSNATAIASALSASTDPSVKNYTWTFTNEGSVIATEKEGYEGRLGVPSFSDIKKDPDGTLEINVTTTTRGVLPQSNLIFKAKYPGSFGGRLSVMTYGTGNVRNVRVYLDKSLLVEDIICDFSDVYSPYYYEQVMRSTQYIEVDPINFNPHGGNPDTYVPLTFSQNYTADKVYLHDRVHKLESGKYIFDYDKIVESLQNTLYDSSYDSGRGRYTALFNDLKDPLIYNFGVIVDGGYNDCKDDSAEISNVDTYLVDLAKQRMDTIYLVSGARGMDPDTFFTYCGMPASDEDVSGFFTFDTSFASAFGPWCYSVLLSNGATRDLPGYYPFLIAWGQSMSNGNPIWLAPAGIKRASLGDIVKDTKYFVGSGVVDLWQNQEFVSDKSGTWKVNPICKLKQYGFVVYGNSTLLKNYHNGATSMLQSFSTRVMVNLIKTRAFDISLTLQFDQVSKDLFIEFRTLMSTFLDQLKRSDALYDYKIVADMSNLTLDDLNSHTVPIKIMISPTPTAENFVINLEISKAGITFNDEGAETTGLVLE